MNCLEYQFDEEGSLIEKSQPIEHFEPQEARRNRTNNSLPSKRYDGKVIDKD